MFSRLISVLLLSRCAFAQMDALTNVTNAFSMAQIVPDVIDSFTPMDLLNITFSDSVTMEMINVDPGDLLTEEQTADEPMFILDTSTDPTADPSMSTFVVIMVDPDAPTPQMPNVSEFLHFLGGDFTADSTTGLLSNSSPALMEFFSPGPPAGSDPHRYVLLVFNQPDDFDTNAPTFVNSTTPRTNFSASAFAQATNLGAPIAGNYFLVGPSDNSTTSPTSTTSDSGSTPTDTSTDTDTTIPTSTSSDSLLPLPSPASLTSISGTSTSPSSATLPASTVSNTSRGHSVRQLDHTIGLAAISLFALMVHLA